MVAWVLWAIKEFSLEGVSVGNFRMAGRELCSLSKLEFLGRAPPFMGDILWEHIDMLRKGGSLKQLSQRRSHLQKSYVMCLYNNYDSSEFFDLLLERSNYALSIL